MTNYVNNRQKMNESHKQGAGNDKRQSLLVEITHFPDNDSEGAGAASN